MLTVQMNIRVLEPVKEQPAPKQECPTLAQQVLPLASAALLLGLMWAGIVLGTRWLWSVFA